MKKLKEINFHPYFGESKESSLIVYFDKSDEYDRGSPLDLSLYFYDTETVNRAAIWDYIQTEFILKKDKCVYSTEEVLNKLNTFLSKELGQTKFKIIGYVDDNLGETFFTLEHDNLRELN